MKKMNKKIILASVLLSSLTLINTASARSNVSLSLNVGTPAIYGYAPVVINSPPPVYYRPHTTIVREERYISNYPNYNYVERGYRPAYIAYPNYRHSDRERYRHRRWIERQRDRDNDRDYYQRQRENDNYYNNRYDGRRVKSSLINSGI